MRMFSLRSAAAAALLVSGTLAATAQEITWDMANEYSATTMVGLADDHFAKLVEEKTGGKIKIVNQFGGASGLRSADLIDAIGTGAIPLGNFPLEVGSGHNPMYLVTNLPLIGQSLDEAAVMQEVARPYLEETMAADNLQLLYMVIWPPVGIWSATPLTSPDALKGLKIRVNHPIAATLFQAAGASPVQVSWGDVIPQLQVGAISAVHTSISGGTLGLPLDIVPYYNAIGTHVGQAAAAINRDELEALPEDLRAAVLEAAAETEAWARDTVKAQVAAETEALVAKGAKLVEGDDMPAEMIAYFREIGQPIITDWLDQSGEAGAAFLDEYRARTQ